jgi:SlyX protein
MPISDTRLTELESKLVFAEDLLEALNLTVYRQQRQIELLEAELRLLNERMRSLTPADPSAPEHEIPPHY